MDWIETDWVETDWVVMDLVETDMVDPKAMLTLIPHSQNKILPLLGSLESSANDLYTLEYEVNGKVSPVQRYSLLFTNAGDTVNIP